MSPGPAMLNAARASLLVSAASLPFSIALTNVSTVLAFLCWALSGRWRATGRAIAAEPAAWLGCVLLALVCLRVPGSEAADAVEIASKYRDLLLFGIVMFLFADERWRARLFWAALASTVALLAVSYGMQLAGMARASGAVLKKSSITHSFLMSLLAYGALVLALRAQGWRRLALSALAAAAALNIVVSVQGRTGYVVLAALAVWLAARRLSWRSLGAAALVALAALLGAYQWAPVFRAGIADTLAEARGIGGDPTHNSLAKRLHYYERSLELIAAHPLAGVGTGAWDDAFYASTAGDHPYFRERTHNHPHNEYLHLGVQVGLAGLVLLAALFAVAYARARGLPELEGELARGLAIAFAVGCLFNDFFLDATEGQVWAILMGALFGAPRRARAPAPQGSARG